MHLVSLHRQRVLIDAAGLNLEFEAGEAIWTREFLQVRTRPGAPVRADAGFGAATQWVDEHALFALTRFLA